MEVVTARELKVLIVDDSIAVGERVAALLSELPGVTVVWNAQNATEAREVLQTFRPDAALLDIRLPDGSGIDLLRELKASSPDTTTIMLTGFSPAIYADACRKAGADYFVNKASSFDEIPDLFRRLAG
jgi:DNA-binding NarL/FixJ family response regulator